MKNVTYYLGAGASCQSMPIMTNFNDRFSIFLAFLNRRGKSNTILNVNGNEFGNTVKFHQTFDTFFKKLFHQRRDKEILEFKGILTLFFLFEHLFFEEDVDATAINEQKDKKFLIDPRYEALIAGLLIPERKTTRLFSNVNFVTWNYDLNLLYALRNFFEAEMPLSKFIKDKFNGSYFDIHPQVKVFHLNGFVNHPLVDKIGQRNRPEIFEDAIRDYNRGRFAEFGKNIKFAWEQSSENMKSNTDNLKSDFLILIGYSLPLFNRFFDLNIINPEQLKNVLIYVQDPKPGSQEMILRNDFDLPSTLERYDSPKIYLTESCDSFLVLSSIFSK